MKVRDLIKAIEQDGWLYQTTAGSHRQYKHPAKQGKVTVSGKPGDDVYAVNLASIRKQAGLPNLGR